MRHCLTSCLLNGLYMLSKAPEWIVYVCFFIFFSTVYMQISSWCSSFSFRRDATSLILLCWFFLWLTHPFSWLIGCTEGKFSSFIIQRWGEYDRLFLKWKFFFFLVAYCCSDFVHTVYTVAWGLSVICFTTDIGIEKDGKIWTY